MLVIRLARAGRKKYPTYRIVAAEKRFAATGKFVEILGRYNPHTKDVSLNKEGIAKRVATGAQPSNRVLKLMKQEGMEIPAWAQIAKKVSKPKPAAEAAAVAKATAAQAAIDAAKEAPAEAVAPVEAEATEATTEPAPATTDAAEAEAIVETAEVTAKVAETAPDKAADPDEKAAASNDAQAAAADAAEAVTLELTTESETPKA